MAGIAFKLLHYMDGESYADILKGYLYSAAFVAGPWLISAVSLGILAFLTQGEMTLNHVIMMYIFSFSLIYVGFFQFVVTRFISDQIYLNKIDSHLPTFMAVLLFTLGPQALLAAWFLSYLETPFLFRWLVFSTYLMTNAIWIILCFLGILRAYKWIACAFIMGAGISLLVGLFTRLILSGSGFLGGFLLGQVFTFSILLCVFIAEFPWKRVVDFSFLSYFRRYPSLATLGVFYYLSTWIDKFVVRFSELGQLITPRFLYAAPGYELPAFLAQLTIVPALAIFFLQVETRFYEGYRRFFSAIKQQQPLAAIEDCKNALLRSVRAGFIRISKIQGCVSLVFILLAPQIFRLLSLDTHQIAILRVLLLGTFFQTLLFLCVILKLYFELYKTALIACTLFLLSNGLFTYGLLSVPALTTGWGFTISAFLAFIYAAVSFLKALGRLPELTFMKQLTAPAIKESFLKHQGGIARYHPLENTDD